jgi:hypothetical protein
MLFSEICKEGTLSVNKATSKLMCMPALKTEQQLSELGMQAKAAKHRGRGNSTRPKVEGRVVRSYCLEETELRAELLASQGECQANYCHLAGDRRLHIRRCFAHLASCRLSTLLLQQRGTKISADGCWTGGL